MKRAAMLSCFLAAAVSMAAQAVDSVKSDGKLDKIHARLTKFSNLHDDYLAVAELGNRETMPLLLIRLRSDYGAFEPSLPPGKSYGFDCAQLHLIRALEFITNSDQGSFYPRWAVWWQENQTRSQHDWILSGFAAAGLHPSDPIDASFAGELIEIMALGNEYRAFNAERLLAGEDSETRRKWLGDAVSSPNRSRRLGAVRFLSLKDAGDTQLLNKLATDDDPEIKREAIQALGSNKTQQ